MAETSDPRRPISQPGTFSRLLTALAQCLKWLLVSLLFSIVIEWIGMVFWWEEQGLAHSRQMLAVELNYLDVDFRRSLLTSDPLQFAGDLADRFYHVLFELTRLADLVEWVTPIPSAGEEGFRVTLHHAYHPMAEFILAAMQMSQVFGVRLAILTLATPVFGLFALVALVDGLVRRDLRRWGGGRESSFVYHYAKKAAFPLVIIAWVVYLALPFSLYPSWIILPFALAFGFAVTITASTFKKYL
jgi:integrating conjugative element membrane protein (TIGR03747 family)|tara:strand:- start:3585 stop:4316 length:732 start_codon:yes stop_codon:yes gene_type:complete